jgi:hypothetical protein
MDPRDKDTKAVDSTVDDDRRRHFNTLIGLSDQFGNTLTSAFAKNIAEGKKFDDVLKSGTNNWAHRVIGTRL